MCRAVSRRMGFLASRLQTTFSRVAVDMAVHETVLYVPAFYLGTGMWRGSSFSEAYDNLVARWMPSTMLAWSIYGPAQVVNFGLVPAPLRPVFLSCMSCTWTVGFSILSNRKHKVAENSSPCCDESMAMTLIQPQNLASMESSGRHGIAVRRPRTVHSAMESQESTCELPWC